MSEYGHFRRSNKTRQKCFLDGLKPETQLAYELYFQFYTKFLWYFLAKWCMVDICGGSNEKLRCLAHDTCMLGKAEVPST